MGKIGALIISFTILFQSFNFEFEDVNKFPVFFNHISSHIESGDSFSDFIDLHYGNKLKDHKDKHKEHKQLPFKHQHLDSCSQLVFVLNDLKFDINFSETGFVYKYFLYKESSTNKCIYSFFQPPQK